MANSLFAVDEHIFNNSEYIFSVGEYKNALGESGLTHYKFPDLLKSIYL